MSTKTNGTKSYKNVTFSFTLTPKEAEMYLEDQKLMLKVIAGWEAIENARKLSSSTSVDEEIDIADLFNYLTIKKATSKLENYDFETISNLKNQITKMLEILNSLKDQ